MTIAPTQLLPALSIVINALACVVYAVDGGWRKNSVLGAAAVPTLVVTF